MELAIDFIFNNNRKGILAFISVFFFQIVIFNMPINKLLKWKLDIIKYSHIDIASLRLKIRITEEKKNLGYCYCIC